MRDTAGCVAYERKCKENRNEKKDKYLSHCSSVKSVCRQYQIFNMTSFWYFNLWQSFDAQTDSIMRCRNWKLRRMLFTKAKAPPWSSTLLYLHEPRVWSGGKIELTLIGMYRSALSIFFFSFRGCENVKITFNYYLSDGHRNIIENHRILTKQYRAHRPARWENRKETFINHFRRKLGNNEV